MNELSWYESVSPHRKRFEFLAVRYCVVCVHCELCMCVRYRYSCDTKTNCYFWYVITQTDTEKLNKFCVHMTTPKNVCKFRELWIREYSSVPLPKFSGFCWLRGWKMLNATTNTASINDISAHRNLVTNFRLRLVITSTMCMHDLLEGADGVSPYGGRLRHSSTFYVLYVVKCIIIRINLILQCSFSTTSASSTLQPSANGRVGRPASIVASVHLPSHIFTRV